MNIRQEKRKKNMHGFAIVLTVIVIVVIAGIFAVIAEDGGFTKQPVESMYYKTDDTGCYALLDEGFAAAHSSGLQVFSFDGKETVHETFLMESPALSSGGPTALLYDIGGRTAKLFSAEKVIKSFNFDGDILSANVNSNGWSAISYMESGYHGGINVYDNYGAIIFKWLSGSGYIMGGCVSPDNTQLAVLTAEKTGARVIFLSLTDGSYREESVLNGQFPAFIAWKNENTLIGFCDSGLYGFEKGSEAKLLCSYAGNHLDGYHIDDTLYFVLNEFKTGGACCVMEMSPEGSFTRILGFENGIISMSANEKYISVLTDSELFIYSKKDMEVSAQYQVSGYLTVMMRDDDNAVCVSRHSADVFSARSK